MRLQAYNRASPSLQLRAHAWRYSSTTELKRKVSGGLGGLPMNATDHLVSCSSQSWLRVNTSPVLPNVQEFYSGLWADGFLKIRNGGPKACCVDGLDAAELIPQTPAHLKHGACCGRLGSRRCQVCTVDAFHECSACSLGHITCSVATRAAAQEPFAASVIARALPAMTQADEKGLLLVPSCGFQNAWGRSKELHWTATRCSVLLRC